VSTKSLRRASGSFARVVLWPSADEPGNRAVKQNKMSPGTQGMESDFACVILSRYYARIGLTTHVRRRQNGWKTSGGTGEKTVPENVSPSALNGMGLELGACISRATATKPAGIEKISSTKRAILV